MDKREAYRRQSRAASATDVYDESQPPLPPEEDGPDYATEEEKDETAKRCLRAFNITGMIFSVAICTAALYATTLAVGPSAQSLAYAVAGANIVLVFVTAVGFCAACSTLRLSLLLGFLASVAILTFGFFALSGFCFILTESLVRYAIANYDVLSVSFPPALRANLTLDRIISGMRGFFYSFGALSFIEALMCIGACSSAIRLVTPLKAYTLLLQASNLAVLPVGVVLIAIGAYLAETGIGADGPLAAFGMFVLGIIVIVVMLIGCMGTSLQSRGILFVFGAVSLLISGIFLAFGAVAFVQSSLIVSQLVSQWSTLSRFLPASFPGKYDKDVFQATIQGSLVSMGFMALAGGLLLASQFWAAHRLRFEIRTQSEIDEELKAVEADLPVDLADALSRSRSKGRLQTEWKRRWTEGSPTSRRLIIAGCVLLSILVAAVIGVACFALYFANYCPKLSAYHDSFTYAPLAAAGAPVIIQVSSSYSRATLSLAVAASPVGSEIAAGPTLVFSKAAYKPGMAPSDYPLAVWATAIVCPGTAGASSACIDALGVGAGGVVNTSTIAAKPAAPSLIAGFDMSCQQSEITLKLPSATALGGSSLAASDAAPLAIVLSAPGGYGAVQADWSSVADASRPRVRYANLTTTAGPVTLTSYLAGAKGLSISTTEGAISLTNVDAVCDPHDIGGSTGGVRAAATVGSVVVSGLTSLDCDVRLASEQAMVSLTGGSIINTLGGGKAYLSNNLGVTTFGSVFAQGITIATGTGAVRSTNATVVESLKIATSSGAVSLQTLRVGSRAVVQIETTSGDINVYASQFAGIASVVTAGSVSCSGGAFSGVSSPCPTISENSLKVAEQVYVNCAAASCPYYAQLAISSQTGNVVLQMDAWTPPT